MYLFIIFHFNYHYKWFIVYRLSVWCVAFFVDFGNVKIPRDLNVPPSLRMLGVEPQTKLNCEVLGENRARFAVFADVYCIF